MTPIEAARAELGPMITALNDAIAAQTIGAGRRFKLDGTSIGIPVGNDYTLRLDLAALVGAVLAGQWRDIASAPKDGTPILIARAGEGVDDIEITEWCVMPQSRFEHVEGDLYRKVEDKPVAFWNGNGHRATHWQPLPPPPKAPPTPA